MYCSSIQKLKKILIRKKIRIKKRRKKSKVRKELFDIKSDISSQKVTNTKYKKKKYKNMEKNYSQMFQIPKGRMAIFNHKNTLKAIHNN